MVIWIATVTNMGWNEDLMNEGTNYMTEDAWLEAEYELRAEYEYEQEQWEQDHPEPDDDYIDDDGDDLHWDFVEENYLNDQADREAHMDYRD